MLCDGFVFYIYLLVIALLAVFICFVGTLCGCTEYFFSPPLERGAMVGITSDKLPIPPSGFSLSAPR